jgi:tagatose-1,6-bisphosphate aldolase non-catalytic subunit AgaZ/GatZ
MTSLPMDPAATPLRPPDWHAELQDTAARARFDPSVPHPACVYAYWLGGKDHHRADRKAAEEVMRRRPQVVAGARANRAFLARTVRYLAAECGIRQFLDIGTGLPAPGSTHQIAQDIAPTAASSTSTTTHWCWPMRAHS